MQASEDVLFLYMGKFGSQALLCCPLGCPLAIKACAPELDGSPSLASRCDLAQQSCPAIAATPSAKELDEDIRRELGGDEDTTGYSIQYQGFL